MDKAQSMKLMAESHRETVEELEEEIKCYREVLDRISNHDVYKIDITAAGKMADRALEGDPHESS